MEDKAKLFVDDKRANFTRRIPFDSIVRPQYQEALPKNRKKNREEKKTKKKL
jgi:hypothetical protein